MTLDFASLHAIYIFYALHEDSKERWQKYTPSSQHVTDRFAMSERPPTHDIFDSSIINDLNTVKMFLTRINGCTMSGEPVILSSPRY